MSVKELIEILSELNPDAEINVDYDMMYHEPKVRRAAEDWGEPKGYIIS